MVVSIQKGPLRQFNQFNDLRKEWDNQSFHMITMLSGASVPPPSDPPPLEGGAEGRICKCAISSPSGSHGARKFLTAW